MTAENFDDKPRVPPDNIDTQLLKRILNNVATREEDTAVALSLIEQGADISKRNYWQDTPLFTAVYLDKFDIAANLIRRGADVNAVHKYNETCLLAAACRGFERTVSLLLENGATTETKNEWGGTPLIAAAHNGHIDAVRILLNAGARADATDNEGQSPRDHAIHSEKKNPDVAKMLEEAEKNQRRQDREKLDQWCDEGLPLETAVAVSPLRRLKLVRRLSS